MPTTWDKLPFELLTRILEYAGPKKKGIQSKKDLCNYQLVCKGWSKAAQIHLYGDINLNDGSLDRRGGPESLNLAKFVNTIRSLAPHLGAFVKTLTICNDLVRLDRPLEALETIFDACHKMGELYCTEDAADIVWPYLLALQDTRDLKSFHKDDTIANSSLYPFVAFKLRKSLTNLQLCINYPNSFEQQLRWRSDYLIEQLPRFVSLKSLRFTGCKFLSYSTLCQAIDRCSPTVSKLSFREYISPLDSTQDINEFSMIKPNYGVKEIYMETCLLHSAKYLAVKFRNLEKFTADRLNPIDVGAGWFAELAELCVSLKEYDLCFNFMREQDIKDGCVELTSRAPHDEQRLLIEYNLTLQEDDIPPWRIVLKKDCSFSSIEVYVPEEDTDFDHHTHWLEGYSPTEIEIRNIDIMIMRKVCLSVVEHYASRRQLGFTTRDSEIYENHISTNAKNWKIFDKVISCTANTPNAKIVLTEMVIIELYQQQATVARNIISNPNIKQLTLKDSLFDFKVLETMSLRLPHLDSLIIDACTVVLDELHTLKLFLPLTKLRRLELVVAPLSALLSSLVPYRSMHHLANDALSRYMSHGLAYTLKIETDEKTYVTTRKGNSEIVVSNTIEEHQDIRQGSANKFLIWIRCQELEEFSVVSRSKNSESPPRNSSTSL